MSKIKKCNNCGGKLLEDDNFCQNCGSFLSNEKKKINENNNGDNMDNGVLGKINTGLATVFSAIFIGLGQLYNGQIVKGICLFIIGLILVFIEFFFNTMLMSAPYWAQESILVLMIIVLIVYVFIWILNVRDAYENSKK